MLHHLTEIACRVKVTASKKLTFQQFVLLETQSYQYRAPIIKLRRFTALFSKKWTPIVEMRYFFTEMPPVINSIIIKAWNFCSFTETEHNLCYVVVI